jgi:outer membrane protein
MSYKKVIIFFAITLLSLNFSILDAKEPIVYIDMNKVMSISIVGKSLNNKIEKYRKSNLVKFNKLLKDLRSEEDKLLAQKNVLNNDEFQKKAKIIQGDFQKYKKSIDDFNLDLDKRVVKSKATILENLTTILSQYAKDNSTVLILNKKNIIIGRTNLEITDVIIEKLNNKIKDTKL